MDITSISMTVLTVLLGAIGITVVGIILGLIYKGIDRKLAAHMQGRIGPPLRQPFLDVRKLLVKENVVPENAIGWIFNLVPLLGLGATITILLYLPIGGLPSVLDGVITAKGDLLVILYLLILPSLAMVIGGFSSGSPYATVGAQREMATMIAYEFPLAIIIISLAWRLSLVPGVTNVFTLSTLLSTPIWSVVGPVGFIGAAILLLALVIVTPAELSKIPFDSPEAETEIADGLMVEYSGRNLGMFYLADGVKMIAMGTIIIALFFPYNLSPFFGLSSYAGAIVDIIFYLVKLFLVLLFSVTLIRVAVARLKIDQIVYTYWVPLTLIGLVGLICLMWDQTIMTNFSIPSMVELLGLA
jgi:formate hydrogenlyase subunit 4